MRTFESLFRGNKNYFEKQVNLAAMSTNVSEFGAPSATSVLILSIPAANTHDHLFYEAHFWGTGCLFV